MSIAESILDIVRESVNGKEFNKLLSVTVKVGELTAVVPDSLNFCFDVIIQDSPFRDAKLNIIQVPLTGFCEACENSFKIQNKQFLCPDCRSTGIKVTGGQELNVTELEVE